jgi:hypothetical protein
MGPEQQVTAQQEVADQAVALLCYCRLSTTSAGRSQVGKQGQGLPGQGLAASQQCQLLQLAVPAQMQQQQGQGRHHSWQHVGRRRFNLLGVRSPKLRVSVAWW